jgi:hypothetical protein
MEIFKDSGDENSTTQFREEVTLADSKQEDRICSEHPNKALKLNT